MLPSQVQIYKLLLPPFQVGKMASQATSQLYQSKIVFQCLKSKTWIRADKELSEAEKLLKCLNTGSSHPD